MNGHSDPAPATVRIFYTPRSAIGRSRPGRDVRWPGESGVRILCWIKAGTGCSRREAEAAACGLVRVHQHCAHKDAQCDLLLKPAFSTAAKIVATHSVLPQAPNSLIPVVIPSPLLDGKHASARFTSFPRQIEWVKPLTKGDYLLLIIIRNKNSVAWKERLTPRTNESHDHRDL